MDVEGSDSRATTISGNSTTTEQNDGCPAAAAATPREPRALPATALGDDDGGDGGNAAVTTPAKKLEYSSRPEEPSDVDKELNGTAGGGGDITAPPSPATAAAVTTSGALASDGGRATTLSVSPATKGLVNGVVVPGKIAAADRVVETPPAVVMTPSTTDPRDDGDAAVRKEDVVVEVRATAAGDAVYGFNKSAPARRGKWSRLEEEYANR